MPFTTIAWAESQDAAAAWVKVAGVPDTSVSVSADDITLEITLALSDHFVSPG